jgi:signal transduction protein with GAF and PtsI domain
VTARDPSHDDATARRDSVERLIASVAARADIARRLQPPALDRLLRSIVEATVELFDAEAASIALLEDGDRLRFRVAAGPQGDGVVGVTVAVGEGIAGYVQQTGQPLAMSDVASDPRFGRETAARTGYIPRSILAVPLELGDQVLGVLEVLDKRGATGFDLDDLARAGVFARQAAVAIDVASVDRDVGRLLVDALVVLTGQADDRGVAEDADAIVAAAIEGGPVVDASFWSFVERLAELRRAHPDQLGLIADMVAAAVGHLPGRSVGRTGDRRTGDRSWRDRIGSAEIDE